MPDLTSNNENILNVLHVQYQINFNVKSIIYMNIGGDMTAIADDASWIKDVCASLRLRGGSMDHHSSGDHD